MFIGYLDNSILLATKLQTFYTYTNKIITYFNILFLLIVESLDNLIINSQQRNTKFKIY